MSRMSHTRFRVHLHFVVVSMSRIWLKTGAISEVLSVCKGIQTHNHLVCKRTLNHLAKLANLVKWLSIRLRTK